MTADRFLSVSEVDAKAADWQRALGLDAEGLPELSHPALLVLDMQNEFLLATGQLPVWGGLSVVPRVRQLAERFRSAGLPVIYTRHLCIEPHKHAKQIGVMRGIPDPDSFLLDGHPGAEIHTDLRPEPGDSVVVKYRYCGFYDTPLDTLLRVQGVEQVIITGVATDICCETTAHDAFFRGYEVLFTLDGTGGTTEEAHLATLKTIQMAYGRIVTVAQVLRSVAAASPMKHETKGEDPC